MRTAISTSPFLLRSTPVFFNFSFVAESRVKHKKKFIVLECFSIVYSRVLVPHNIINDTFFRTRIFG